ncbi:hypothetical protein [Hominibacterium faecale]|uniref:hypothetical protein n=1 Tax=Hominibacterium faecale TaxID=2839743 RepID=UPI0022B2A368|nr:hypothetical protein [Hominibacterium faecale]
MITEIDKSINKIGFVTEIFKDQGRTGYQIQMLIRSKEYMFDTEKDVYDFIDAGRYGQYPSIVEFLYMPIFDENGIVKQLIMADTFENENGLLQTHIEFGTYAMFKYKISDETLKTGDFFTIEGNTLTFDKFDENKDKLVYLEYGGSVPAPKNGMSLKLAPDVDVYIWDWRKALKPFSISCTREEAIANKFVTRFQVGQLEDIKLGHWIDLVSARGDESVIDTIVCFINKAPGWTF